MTAGEAPVAESRERPADERLGDALFTGLRLTAGLDFDEIGARYGLDAWGRYEEALRLAGISRPSHHRRASRPADPGRHAGGE